MAGPGGRDTRKPSFPDDGCKKGKEPVIATVYLGAGTVRQAKDRTAAEYGLTRRQGDYSEIGRAGLQMERSLPTGVTGNRN